MENIVAVGGVVEKIDEVYYLYNPINCLSLYNLYSSKLNTINKDLSGRLFWLKKVLLTKNKPQVKIHIEQILHVLEEFTNTIESFVKKNDDKIAILSEYNKEWPLYWVLNKLKDAELYEDCYYYECVGLPFTDDERQKQLELRENFFGVYWEDREDRGLNVEEDLVDYIEEIYNILSNYAPEES